MARRGYDVRVTCTHPGCKEWSPYHFDTRAEMKRHFDREPQATWKCIRHSRPDDVLSAENRTRVEVLTNFETDNGKFWGTSRPFSGFASGYGFRAFSDDFPPGTRIKVTAELILPDET